jgi:hypothetical protein
MAGHLKILEKSMDTSFGEVCPKSIGKIYITKKNSKFWVSRLRAPKIITKSTGIEFREIWEHE